MTEDWTRVAAEVLSMAKLLAPQKAPAASAEVAEAWGAEMAEYGYPRQFWEQAIRVWAKELVEDQLDFRQLLTAVRVVVNRMEHGTYEQRLWLEQWRARRLQDRYRLLGLGDGGIEVPSAPQDRSLPPDRRADEQFLTQLRSSSQNANKGSS